MNKSLLQQIEHFPGILIAATSLMDGLDAAALRRFDFKLHFRPLTPAQRLALFAREALGATCTPPGHSAHHSPTQLQSLEQLTREFRQRGAATQSLGETWHRRSSCGG